MNDSTRSKLQSATDCELRFDTLTRQLYATDASIYQIEPWGVAFPGTTEQASALIATAIDNDVPVIPRGAGTSLAGGAIGEGLIVDFSRYRRQIRNLDLEAETVFAESGVVLDQLNAYLKPHARCFGPDVAPSSRATLGGMIGNNSSGARAPLYGTTVDHVVSLEIVTAEGKRATVGKDLHDLDSLRSDIGTLLDAHRAEIDARFPDGLVKRWPGYGLERWHRSSPDLTRILCASEGTLAAITGATLRLSPLPKEKGIAVVFFPTVMEAMRATVEFLDLQPAAIEHCDRVLFDQTRGQLPFARARALLGLDDDPCDAFLVIEFYEDVADRLAQVAERNVGVRTITLTEDADMAHVWGLRKAGLSLLTGRPGDAKPTAGIEDVAVLPERLPDYVEGLQRLMATQSLSGSFYGHAAAGLLHVRPVVDLHDADDLKKYRWLAEEVSALVKQVKGSIAAEHGVGIARAEFLEDHVGSKLMQVMRDIKHRFDPKGLMNPGKIFSDGGHRIDTNLRQGANSNISLPFEPQLGFVQKDNSFVGNLEQCNGCGGCRKDAPTMCPTFIATGEEIMSTRGRANTIRAVLEARTEDADGINDPALWEALDTCLSCKACTVECPSNVNMALLKAELLHARNAERGVSLGTRMLSRPDLLGRWAFRAPKLANTVMRTGWGRALVSRAFGVSPDRPLPAYAARSFEDWYSDHDIDDQGPKGTVQIWDDCFVRYNHPNTGAAAVRVLQALGYGVDLAYGASCCGRPAFSLGRLDVARALAEENVAKLRGSDAPIIFLEPSCYSMFVEDYLELGIEGAEELATRAVLFETFVDRELAESPGAIEFGRADSPVAIHTHCHMKATVDPGVSASLAAHVPEANPKVLNTGCCGMAGAFGMMEKTSDLSLKVAEPLRDALQDLQPGTRLVASGTSCRQQIEHIHDVAPVHMAEWLADHLPE